MLWESQQIQHLPSLFPRFRFSYLSFKIPRISVSHRHLVHLSSVNPACEPSLRLDWLEWLRCGPHFWIKLGSSIKKTMDGETVGDFKPNIFDNLDYNHRVVLVAKCWDLPNPHICPMTYLPSISPGMGRTILLSAKTPWINFRTAQSS